MNAPHRSLGLVDLTLIGFGAIFGSGWLFAAAHVADLAGPAGIVSWVIGGIAVFAIGLVYCELGAALPLTGSVVVHPARAHGPVAGFLMGTITTIAYSSLIAIEIVAARQYAGAWWPELNADAQGNPTLLGWGAQALALSVLLMLNRRGIATFALVNNIVTLFKFCVPAGVAILLLAHFHKANLTIAGFAPHGTLGVETAVSTGGVIFAYLGLTPILAVAGDVRRPQRTIPLALLLSIVVATLVYVLLQTAFCGALPTGNIVHGWKGITAQYPLPFHDLVALIGGLGLASIVVADAVISPTGTANIYLTSTARVLQAWASLQRNSGGKLARLAAGDPQSNTPTAALIASYGLALFWTLPFPSWQALIGVVSSALMLSYAFAPPTAAGLRHSEPALPRPFHLPGFDIIATLAFVIASLIVLWSGWGVLHWLLPVLFALYVISALTTRHTASFRSTAWIGLYLLGLLVISVCGPYGGLAWLSPLTTMFATFFLAAGIQKLARHSAQKITE